jgi:glycosyltransferase involved in cell wall biosynthesis
MKVAMLTSVGDRCGIAAYTRALVEALGKLVELSVEPITVGKQSSEHYEDQAARLNQADVVHIQHEHSFWGGILPNQSAFWVLRYLVDKPVVVTAHTTTSLAELLKVRQERRPAHRIAKELLLRRKGYRDSVETAPFITGRCIVHTEGGRRDLIARGANPKYVHVIPAGVPAALPAKAGGESFRERFGLRGKRVVSLFGFIAPNKGYELTLDVLPSMPEDVTLVIAGGVRVADLELYAEGLRRRVRETGLEGRVVITGYLDEPEVAEAMAASDLVLAPHTQATGSYSIMVPLAYGRPILASDLDCFGEIQGRLPCLSLFRANDQDDYRRKLAALLDDPGERERLAGAAREYAQSNGWPSVAGRTVQVYGEAIEDVTRLGHHGMAAT